MWSKQVASLSLLMLIAISKYLNFEWMELGKMVKGSTTNLMFLINGLCFDNHGLFGKWQSTN